MLWEIRPFMFVFISSWTLQKFQGNRFPKYLNQYRTHRLPVTKYKQKLLHDPTCYFMLGKLRRCIKQRIWTSMLLDSCDQHISPFSLNLHLSLVWRLIGVALNVIVHWSSYCKCNIAWCQVRAFLLLTVWTHPLQMRENPLQYAATDRIK